MAMNLQEIIFLNTALDGKQISFLPDFEKHRMSKFYSDDVINALISKEIMEDKSTLTKQGAYLVKRVYDFKRAKKYVKLGSIVIAFTCSDSGVVLKHIPQKKQYYFERIEMKDNLGDLNEEYPFLRKNSNSEDDCAKNKEPLLQDNDSSVEEKNYESISYEDLVETYNLGFHNTIIISSFEKLEEELKVTNEVIFQSDNKLYFYDRDTQALAVKRANDLQELLSRRLSV